VRDGYDYKEISQFLNISPGRVSNALGEIRAGIRVPTRRHLSIWCMQHPEALGDPPEWVDPTFHPPDCECGGDYCSRHSRRNGRRAIEVAGRKHLVPPLSLMPDLEEPPAELATVDGPMVMPGS